MTLERVRKMVLLRSKPYSKRRGFGLRTWCAAHGVHASHASEFLRGKRLPTTDLLNALGLEWRVMRKAKP